MTFTGPVCHCAAIRCAAAANTYCAQQPRARFPHTAGHRCAEVGRGKSLCPRWLRRVIKRRRRSSRQQPGRDVQDGDKYGRACGPVPRSAQPSSWRNRFSKSGQPPRCLQGRELDRQSTFQTTTTVSTVLSLFRACCLRSTRGSRVSRRPSNRRTRVHSSTVLSTKKAHAKDGIAP